MCDKNNIVLQVCTLCYKSTKEKHHGFMKADQPPPKKRRGNSHTFSLPRDPGDFFDTSHQEEEEKIMPSDVTCPLCRRKFSIGSFKLLHSQPPPLGGLPYFPFLNELPMPDDTGDMDEDKQCRVRACQACTTSLINQWTTYQRDQISIEERSYLYQSPLGIIFEQKNQVGSADCSHNCHYAFRSQINNGRWPTSNPDKSSVTKGWGDSRQTVSVVQLV
jgi:hypothetical protein